MKDRRISMELVPEDTLISPLIFGHFIEFIENCVQGGVCDPASPASGADGIRQDVLKKAQGLHPTILRWPGGTYANIYHWMDAVGPMGQRRKRKNLIWGGINDNAFGTAEFIRYCRALGAEPMLCVNMASGTAQEAAEWVEYCNGEPGTYFADLRAEHGYPDPFGVKYWCIGNESSAVPDLGPQHVPERYISDAWEFAKHMKLMDPSIRLVFVGDLLNPGWNTKILESLGPVCDYFSIHHYSGEGGMGMYGPFASLRDFRESLDRFLPVLHEFSGRREPFSKWYRFPGRQEAIRLAVDEWNIWNSTPMGEDNRYGLKMTYDWKDALWTACMMNTFVMHAGDVGIANLAQMVNVLAPIMTDGSDSWVQTTYHVLALYREFLSGTKVDCHFSAPVTQQGKAGSLSMLDACACRDADGNITLFLVNISADDPLEIVLPGTCAPVRSVRLSAPDFSASNALDRECVQRTEREETGTAVEVAPGEVCAVFLKKDS